MAEEALGDELSSRSPPPANNGYSIATQILAIPNTSYSKVSIHQHTFDVVKVDILEKTLPIIKGI